jgi:hypothetical protein
MLAVPPLHARATPAITQLETKSTRNKKDRVMESSVWLHLPAVTKFVHGSQLAPEQRFCVQAPLQQSEAAEHGAPSEKQLDAHTKIPCAFATHVPAQQSASTMHGKSGGRHGPGPSSQRLEFGSHTPEQQSLACAQRSAVRRHVVSSAMHDPFSQ